MDIHNMEKLLIFGRRFDFLMFCLLGRGGVAVVLRRDLPDSTQPYISARSGEAIT